MRRGDVAASQKLTGDIPPRWNYQVALVSGPGLAHRNSKGASEIVSDDSSTGTESKELRSTSSRKKASQQRQAKASLSEGSVSGANTAAGNLGSGRIQRRASGIEVSAGGSSLADRSGTSVPTRPVQNCPVDDRAALAELS
ncbi:hypothetical protein MTO96_014410 [Rhipicephalus appendiculatus]